MKNIFYLFIVVLAIILALFISCNRDSDPVGPSILKEFGPIDLNTYIAVRTNLYLSFTGIGEKEGFAGSWLPAGFNMPCLNTSGSNLVIGFDDLEPDDNSWFWGTSITNDMSNANLCGVLKEGEILVFNMKAKCINEGNYKPGRIYVEFIRKDVISDNTYSYFCRCTFPRPLPTEWSNIALHLSDLIKVDKKSNPVFGDNYLSAKEILEKTATLKIGIAGTTMNQSIRVHLDDIRIVVYRKQD